MRKLVTADRIVYLGDFDCQTHCRNSSWYSQRKMAMASQKEDGYGYRWNGALIIGLFVRVVRHPRSSLYKYIAL